MFAVPPSEDQLPQAGPGAALAAGQGQVARGRPGGGGRRPRAGGVGLPRQGKGRRPRPVLPRRQDRRHRAGGQPLKINPWGGPSVQRQDGRGQRQHHRLRPQGAQGRQGRVVAAFDLDDGKEKWHKEVPGRRRVVRRPDRRRWRVVTATDGKVRAFDLATRRARAGTTTPRRRSSPPPAVAGGVVYAGDLKGVRPRHRPGRRRRASGSWTWRPTRPSRRPA